MKTILLRSATIATRPASTAAERVRECLAGEKQSPFSRQSSFRQAQARTLSAPPSEPEGGFPQEANLESAMLASLLKRRASGGSLWSVRIPVTRANRQLLRALRAAEVTVWNGEGC